MSSTTIWNNTDIRIKIVVAAQRCYQHTIHTIMKLCWYVEYIFSSSGLLNYTITHHAQLPALELNAGTDSTGNQEVWINNVSVIMVNANESGVDLCCANFAMMAELAWFLFTSAVHQPPPPSLNHPVSVWLTGGLSCFGSTPVLLVGFFLRLQCLQWSSGGRGLADQLKTSPIWNKNEIVLKPCKITLCTFKIQHCWERCALGFLNISQWIL